MFANCRSHRCGCRRGSLNRILRHLTLDVVGGQLYQYITYGHGDVVWPLQFVVAVGGEIVCRSSAGRGDGPILGRACWPCGVLLTVTLPSSSDSEKSVPNSPISEFWFLILKDDLLVELLELPSSLPTTYWERDRQTSYSFARFVYYFRLSGTHTALQPVILRQPLTF